MKLEHVVFRQGSRLLLQLGRPQRSRSPVRPAVCMKTSEHKPVNNTRQTEVYVHVCTVQVLGEYLVTFQPSSTSVCLGVLLVTRYKA